MLNADRWKIIDLICGIYGLILLYNNNSELLQ